MKGLSRRRFMQAASGLMVPGVAGAGLLGMTPKVFVGGGGGGSPLDLPLATQANLPITYLGFFNVNLAFEYGAGAMSLDGAGNMYVAGLDTANTLGKLAIPSIGGTATTVISPVSVTGDVSPTGLEQRLTGSLYKGGTLLISGTTFYDNDNAQNKWVKTANASVGSQGAWSGSTTVRGSSNRMISGPMMHIPSIWQPILGGDAAVLGCHLNIISTSQCGYGFGVFNFADVVSGGTSVPVNDLIGYDFSNPLEPLPSPGPPWTTYPKNSSGGTDYFSYSTTPLGTAFIPPGSRSLVYVTTQGYGYSSTGHGACRPDSSVNNDPYRVQLTAYDLQEAVDVKNGISNRDDPFPTSFWELPNWSAIWDECVGDYPGAGTFCYDPVTMRLYGNANGFHGSALRIYVWQLGAVS